MSRAAGIDKDGRWRGHERACVACPRLVRLHAGKNRRVASLSSSVPRVCRVSCVEGTKVGSEDC
jgi:hypothetical protein